MSSTKFVERVAIVGASGTIGKHITDALLQTGKHTITALTRTDSTATFPSGVHAVSVNYDDEVSLVTALKGQKFLILTLSVRSPPDLHSKLVRAAVKAGVPYIMPNAFGGDFTNESLVKEDMYSAGTLEKLDEIRLLGGSYVAMVCGFWYDFSLPGGNQSFGIDIEERKATLFDDGKALITTSTLPQCGKAVAALLSLPESGASPSVSDWKNKPFYVASFTVSQLDMLASLQRVSGTTEDEWQFKHEDSSERYQKALSDLKGGDHTGFLTAMYTRLFFANGDGDHETKGLANDAIGLKKEDLDEVTAQVWRDVQAGKDIFY